MQLQPLKSWGCSRWREAENVRRNIPPREHRPRLGRLATKSISRRFGPTKAIFLPFLVGCESGFEWLSSRRMRDHAFRPPVHVCTSVCASTIVNARDANAQTLVVHRMHEDHTGERSVEITVFAREPSRTDKMDAHASVWHWKYTLSSLLYIIK